MCAALQCDSTLWFTRTLAGISLDDVAEMGALSQQLLGASFTLVGMTPRRFERVASVGPTCAGAALPCQARIHNQPDDRHAGGAVHRFATGVVQHVVTTDVALRSPQ